MSYTWTPKGGTTKVVLCCYRCGKAIRGQAVHTNPHVLLLRLGDFAKAYHPKCYELSEIEAGKELWG
jgi:hypothetical protein